MKIKEEKPIFLRVFGIAVLILLVNLGSFLYSDFLLKNGSNKGLTGFSISEFVMNPISFVDLVPKFFFVLQWIVLGFLLIFVAIKDSKLKLNSQTLKDVKINPSKQHTDLDKLYDLLIEKKQIRAVDVSRLFNVNKEIVLEWFKILESGDLAIIDYPMFGGPVIKIDESSDRNKIENNKFKDKEIKQNDKSKEDKKKIEVNEEIQVEDEHGNNKKIIKNNNVQKFNKVVKGNVNGKKLKENFKVKKKVSKIKKK